MARDLELLVTKDLLALMKLASYARSFIVHAEDLESSRHVG